jgi:hypothetical protein
MAFLSAIPFAITEGAVLLESAGPILSTIAGGVTNILAFTGASTLINEAVDAFKNKPEEALPKGLKGPEEALSKEDITLHDPTKQSFINQNPAMAKKEMNLKMLMNRSLQNL